MTTNTTTPGAGRRTLSASLTAAVLLLAAGGAAAQSLGTYAIDEGAISVSGISSGGYMAQQVHVAFSGRVMGAGIIAGGPYWCAEGNVGLALTRCMAGTAGGPPVDTLVGVTRVVAQSGDIDPVDGMRDDRVYLFSGTVDQTVVPAVMQALDQYYRAFVAEENIEFVATVDAPHAHVTDLPTSQQCLQACDRPADTCPDATTCAPTGLCTFVNNCEYDTAGAILAHIYGDLEPRTEPSRDNLLTFDQGAFVDDPASHSMAETGHVYVPAACRSGDTDCRLHVAFHGCLQADERIGDAYYWGAGYNGWAEANDIVVLYPQVVRSLLPVNPQGCWDWWGYDSVYYYRRQGTQMQAVNAMIDRLVGADAAAAQ